MIPDTKFVEENTCVKIYNPETKEVIATYPTFKRAGVELGVPQAAVSRRCRSKQRLFSPKLNMEVACRVAKKDLI